jgi:hypothetical protein
MRQRGRKSSSSLQILPLAPAKRQPPPPSLSAEEAAEWTAIVNHQPGGWFGRTTHALLAAYCRHTVEADRLSGMLAALNDAMDEEVRRGRPELELLFDSSMDLREKLLRMRERETRAATALARSMRLTQQSLYDKTKAVQRHEGPSPWLPHEWKHPSERD